MYNLTILSLKEVPVFSLSDVSQIVSGKDYAKKLLRKLKRDHVIKKIKRNKYTFYDDPFLVSTFLVKPSYISSVSALSFHKLITQIPKEVFCFTQKNRVEINFIEDIHFIPTRYFFGFQNQKYGGFEILIANPEKAIIDSIGIVPFSVFEEAIDKINIDEMISLLKKIKKSSIVKRIGYLLEKKGFDVSDLKSKINNRYIYLDPLAKKLGKKNTKWKMVINTK